MKLPYSIEARMANWKARPFFKAALDLPPINSSPPEMKAELHMMLSKMHLLRAVASLKSFYYNSGLADRVGLMIHMDGSVKGKDRLWLEKCLPGAALTDFPSTDRRVLEALKDLPYCRNYYERKLSCMTRLVHMPLLARSSRVIQLDSDIIFFGRPQAMIDWVDNPKSPPMYQRDWRHDPNPGPAARRGFESFFSSMKRFKRPVEMKDYFVCAGLIMFDTNRFSFDLVEDYLAWHASAKDRPDAFWFSDWTVELTAFMLNFNSWPDSKALDESYAIGDIPSPVCNHFFGGSMYRRTNLVRIRRELKELRK